MLDFDDEERRQRIAALPALHYHCGADLWRGPDAYSVRWEWRRNLDAKLGDQVYLRQFSIEWHWPMLRIYCVGFPRIRFY